MKTCDLTFEFVDDVFMYYVNIVSLVTPWLERNEFEDIKSSYAHPKNITLWEQPIKSFRNVSCQFSVVVLFIRSYENRFICLNQ